MARLLQTMLRSLMCVLFVAMLLLPALQMFTRYVPKWPLDENRSLAVAPKWRELVHPAAFLDQGLRWFEDHYGLREVLIRLKTQIDYSVFGASDKLHIGRDGWLFYRSVIDREEPEVERLTETELAQVVGNFARLRDVLAARGITLVVMTNQLSDRFYPEYLPWSAARALGRHRFDDFRALLRGLPGIVYLDTTDALLALKASLPLFHKTDFHWNDPTAAVFARRLVDTIAAREGRALPFWQDRTRVVTRPFSGGEARFMPLFRPPEEESIFLERTEAPRVDRVGITLPFESAWRARPGAGGLLPPMVMFSDSFSDGMENAGLYDFFEESRRARYLSGTLAEVVARTPPGTKYFIYQFIEVTLPMLRKMPLE